MASSKKINHDKTSKNVMDVIYNRRAVRDYLATKIDQDLIDTLLNAAIQAPTAMHEEPWSFVIIQNKDLLNRLSENAKKNDTRCSEAFRASKSKAYCRFDQASRVQHIL